MGSHQQSWWFSEINLGTETGPRIDFGRKHKGRESVAARTNVADGTMATLLNKSGGFDGFGPSILAQQMRGRLQGINISDRRLESRKLLHQECPLVPGVYGWLDENNRLIYVGKSKSLRKRLLSYFAKTPTDNKADRIRQHSQSIVWEPISHELLALIREQELIHRWRPDLNSMGQPTRTQPAFLCIGGSPAPNARLVRRLIGNHTHAFGPISGTGRMGQAVVSLNQFFNLRDCPDKTRFQFQDQQFLFDNPTTEKFIRYELNTCPAPCAGLCSVSSYSTQVARALDFLIGNSPGTLKSLEDKMQAAAANGEFESAAIARDRLDDLTWLDRQLNSLRLADKHLNGVLRIQARRNRVAWILLRGGRIIETMPEPVGSNRAATARKRVISVAATTAESTSDLLEMNLQLIVISWFRKYPAIKQQIISFDDAIQHCELQSHRSLVAA